MVAVVDVVEVDAVGADARGQVEGGVAERFVAGSGDCGDVAVVVVGEVIAVGILQTVGTGDVGVAEAITVEDVPRRIVAGDGL